MPGLNIALDVEGLDLLLDAYQNSPERVIDAADRAGQKAVDLLGPAIREQTPERSGFLKRSEKVRLEDHFALTFYAGAFYASFVLKRNNFVERGQADVQAEVDAVYESEFESLAATFFEGR